MKRMMALATATLFAAQVAAAETPAVAPNDVNAQPGGRGATFWTGVGLLAGGLGLTAFAATRSHHCGSMMGRECVGMLEHSAAMNEMMQGMHAGVQWTQPPAASPPDGASHHSGHGDSNALAIGVGVAAATAGLVLVLVSRKDRKPSPSVQLRPGIGRVAVVYSF